MSDNDDDLWNQAVQWQESRGNPKAVSDAGALGTMQTMPSTLVDPGYGVTPAKNNSPEELARVGRDYRAAMFAKYPDKNEALMAYNWGPGHVDQWIANGRNPEHVPDETADYVSKVNGYYSQLKSSQAPQATQVQMETTPASYQTTQEVSSDPVEAAFQARLAEKNLPAATDSTAPAAGPPSADPVEAAFQQRLAQKDSAQGTSDKPSGVYVPGQGFVSPENLEAENEGFKRGFKNFGNSLVNAGAWVDNKLGISSDKELAQLHAGQNASKADYQKKYGDNPYADSGQVSSELLTAVPTMEAGGGIVSRGLGAAGDALPYLKPITNFLTGGVESNAVKNEAGQILTPATKLNQAARVAQTVPVGASQGAAFNALTGEDPVQGAKVGATLGPAAKLGGDALTAIYNKAKGIGGDLSPALQKILERAKADGLSPQQISEQLDKLGPNATMGDLGPNLGGLQTSVLQVPGPGMPIVKNALEARNAGQADRLRSLAMNGLKTDPNASYMATEAGLSEKQAADAAPLYKEAHAANQDVKTPEINRILNTPAGKQALRNAATTMQNGRELLGVSNPDLVEQAALGGQEPTGVGISNGLKLKTLDQVKQELYDLGEAAKVNGQPTANSRAIHGLRSDLTKELDKADTTAVRDKQGNLIQPGKYAQARAAFADPAESKEALENGYNFMKSGAEENSALLKNMSDAQKPFLRVGAANWIKDTLTNAPDGANVVNRIFGSPGKREALKSIFPSEADFNEFEKEVQKEKTFAETHNYSRNSLTTPYRESIDDLNKQPSKLANMTTAIKNVAPGGGSIAASVGLHSPWPMVADTTQKVARGVYNKLTQPGPISGATSAELGHTMATPFAPESSLNKLKPAAKNAPERPGIIDWYMQHLGVPTGVAVNNLVKPQQSESSGK